MMIYKTFAGIALTFTSFMALAHSGHGAHIDFLMANNLQEIFDISGFLLLVLSFLALKLYQVKK